MKRKPNLGLRFFFSKNPYKVKALQEGVLLLYCTL